MAERPRPGPGASEQELRAEIVRQDKIIRALMNQAERSRMDADGSDFGAFQTTIILEQQVRRRTVELEGALHENEKITRQLRNSEARFRSVVDQPLVGIAVIEDGKFTFTNAKFCDIFGYTADELRHLGPVDLATKEDEPLVADRLSRRLSGELKFVDYTFRGRRKDETAVDIELHSSVTALGEKPVIVSMVMDVSERMRAERETQALYALLREQSIRDPLTGLFNRRYLDATLERELILAQRQGHPVSVVMCDFDHFKAVNDGYGHLAGDEVLRTFATVLMKHCRGSDIGCRYGGEEFMLVMPDMPEATAYERAERVRAAIEETPITHGDVGFTVTASFGVASFPRCGRNTADLLAAADAALYAAKRGGRNRVNFCPDPDLTSLASMRNGTAAIENRAVSGNVT